MYTMTRATTRSSRSAPRRTLRLLPRILASVGGVAPPAASTPAARAGCVRWLLSAWLGGSGASAIGAGLTASGVDLRRLHGSLLHSRVGCHGDCPEADEAAQISAHESCPHYSTRRCLVHSGLASSLPLQSTSSRWLALLSSRGRSGSRAVLCQCAQAAVRVCTQLLQRAQASRMKGWGRVHLWTAFDRQAVRLPAAAPVRHPVHAAELACDPFTGPPAVSFRWRAHTKV